MSRIAELLGLKAQVAKLENEINNEVVSFTKEELIEFTKTISNAVANGVKFELSKKDNFDFAGALYTKRNSEVMGGLEVNSFLFKSFITFHVLNLVHDFILIFSYNRTQIITY